MNINLHGSFFPEIVANIVDVVVNPVPLQVFDRKSRFSSQMCSKEFTYAKQNSSIVTKVSVTKEEK